MHSRWLFIKSKHHFCILPFVHSGNNFVYKFVHQQTSKEFVKTESMPNKIKLPHQMCFNEIKIYFRNVIFIIDTTYVDLYC